MKLDNLIEINSSKTIKFNSGKTYSSDQGVFKPIEIASSKKQAQTQDTFGFKWKKKDTFDSDNNLLRMKNWLLDRYGKPSVWINSFKDDVLLLDAGCGAGLSAFEYFSDFFDKIKYVGVDISEAVEVAKERADERNIKNTLFFQETLTNLPFEKETFDIIFSEGVLHHTDNTRKTFEYLCQFLKPNGLFMFYIYRKKGPIREFTDDYIRQILVERTPQEGWDLLKGLTHLGIEFGKLNMDIDIPEDIDLLGIPKGKINLQRFIYWHVFKAFYDPNLSFDEMLHINFDWYAPYNAHRHTVEEVKEWCQSSLMDIQELKEEPAGITCIAKKR